MYTRISHVFEPQTLITIFVLNWITIVHKVNETIRKYIAHTDFLSPEIQDIVINAHTLTQTHTENTKNMQLRIFCRAHIELKNCCTV